MQQEKDFKTSLENFGEEQEASFSEVRDIVERGMSEALRNYFSRFQSNAILQTYFHDEGCEEKFIQNQIERWNCLFEAGVNDDYRDAAFRNGSAQRHAGLSPSDCVSFYSFIIDVFLPQFINVNRKNSYALSAFVRSVFVDMNLALTAHFELDKEDIKRNEALLFSDTIKDELDHSKVVLDSLCDDLDGASKGLTNSITNMSEGVDSVDRSSEATEMAIRTVASRIEEIQSNSLEVGGQAESMSKLASDAVSKTDIAGTTIEQLKETALKISDITALIDTISRQTNLLSLNATIEAARAGEAGKGFAVVAGEVKALSEQTANAARQISENITNVEQAVSTTVTNMSEITQIIGQMNLAADSVAGNVSNQVSALNDLSSSAQDAANGAVEQRNPINMFTETVSDLRNVSEVLGSKVGVINLTFDRLGHRLAITANKMGDVDSRSQARLPCNIGVGLTSNGQRYNSSARDISLEGSLLDLKEGVLSVGSIIEIDYQNIGTIKANVQGHQPLGTRFRFVDMETDVKNKLIAFIKGAEAREQKYLQILQERRDMVVSEFERGLSSGQISQVDLFDQAYVPIAGTNPEQVTTKALPYLDEVLPNIIEPVLAMDDSFVFCAAVDRNGYLPVHNKQYSKPQGDAPIWNAANSRNRRIFDDPTGLSAGRNRKVHLIQTYLRELGGSKTQFMKDISMPIEVNGQHWGGLRLALSIT